MHSCLVNKAQFQLSISNCNYDIVVCQGKGRLNTKKNNNLKSEVMHPGYEGVETDILSEKRRI